MASKEKIAYLQSLYEELYHFDTGNMWIVRNRVTGQLCIRKHLSVYNEQVYIWLKDHHSIHVCSIMDAWKEENQLVVIEELISGTTLAEEMDNNMLSKEQKKEVFFQILDGVSFLHHADPAIIHRDLKAENIMITPDLTAKIIDYNAAKIIKPLQRRDTVLIGTEGSAAPEQYGFGPSDERTDIYALGMLMKQMFPDDRAMLKIADHACRIDPDQRYESIEKLKEALGFDQRTSLHLNIPGFRSGTPSRMGAAVLVYAFILFLFFTMQFKDENGQPASAYVTWVNRLCMLVTVIGWIDLFTDWTGFWKRQKWMKSRNTFMRIIGYACSAILIPAVCALIAALLEQNV